MNDGTSDGVETTFHHKEILPGKFTLVFFCGSFPKEIIPYKKMLFERVSAIRLLYLGRALRAMSLKGSRCKAPSGLKQTSSFRMTHISQPLCNMGSKICSSHPQLFYKKFNIELWGCRCEVVTSRRITCA